MAEILGALDRNFQRVDWLRLLTGKPLFGFFCFFGERSSKSRLFFDTRTLLLELLFFIRLYLSRATTVGAFRLFVMVSMFLVTVVFFLCFAAFDRFWDRNRSYCDWDWNGLFNLNDRLITDYVQICLGIDLALRKLTADCPRLELSNSLPVTFKLLQRNLSLPFALLVLPLSNASAKLRLALSGSPATELFSKLRFDLSFLDSSLFSLFLSNSVLHLS